MYNIDKDVLDIIEQNLTPKKTEKNLFGEVFTPVKLVCEMLEQLPIEVWTNPNLKWLDPANGIGNFPIVIYFKLMTTLPIDEKIRSKHIIENMLYMNEINPVNIEMCKKIFNMIDANATPNVNKGDFLNTQLFSSIKFDIIIGNPPYQEVTTEGISKHGSGKIYPNFIQYSLQLLVDDGYLLFITPNTWFTGVSKTGQILNLFKKYNLLKINCSNISRYFPKVGTGTLVYFLLQKNNKYNATELLQSNKYILNIKDKEFLPNILNRFSISILDKTLFSKQYSKFKFIKDSGPFHIKYGLKDLKTLTTRSDDIDRVKKVKDDIHLCPIFHTNKQTLYSSIENCFQKHKKILISQSSKFEPFYDNGQLGFTQNVVAILVNSKKEADHIIKILHSKLYTFLLDCIRYSKNITIHYLNFFPCPTDLNENFTDEDLYTLFDLTKEEIEYLINR